MLELAGAPRDRSRAERTLAALLSEVPDAGGWEPRLAFSEPDEDDQIFVEETMEEDSEDTERFRDFCRRRGVSVRAAVSDVVLCAAFVDELLGSPLVTVTLPRDKPEAAFAQLVAFAARHGLVLHDPQADAAVDLADPGTLPSRY